MNFGIFGGGHCNVTSSDVGALCMHPTLQGQQLLVDDVPRTKGAAPLRKCICGSAPQLQYWLSTRRSIYVSKVRKISSIIGVLSHNISQKLCVPFVPWNNVWALVHGF